MVGVGGFEPLAADHTLLQATILQTAVWNNSLYLVGSTGFEPALPRLKVWCSRPIKLRSVLGGLKGLEPLCHDLKGRCLPIQPQTHIFSLAKERGFEPRPQGFGDLHATVTTLRQNWRTRRVSNSRPSDRQSDALTN